MKLDFKDKVVIVTGGSSGIGEATALAFSDAGARVVVIDQKPSDGKQVGELMLTDVSSKSDVDKTIRKVMKKFGRIDVLVNNAGIEYNTVGNLIDMPYEKLKRIIDVNLYGYIHCVRSVIPHMKSGGRVVNIGSVQSFAAHSPGTSYQITKAGILGLTRALAIEVAKESITVNAVAPGAIATAGIGAVRGGESKIMDKYRRRIPLGRRGWPHEVAAAILFLASEQASYITGTTLIVDGGYLADITPDSEETPSVANDPDKD